jgi:putative SOS response-associated peptidase YedK
MCGRYVSVSSPTLLGSYFGAEEVRAVDVDANYNVTPRAEVPIVAVSGDVRVVDRVRWGLVPWFAKDVAIGDKLINARSETVTTKPAYRRAFERRRCIIPADGFYEWKKIGARQRQPHFIHAQDGEPLAFAGLWENWFDPAVDDAPRLRSCTIVTTIANDDLEPLHSRMPVVLPASVWSSWLDPANHDTDALQRLLVPAPNGELTHYPVSLLVNNADNNGPELVDPVDEVIDDEPAADSPALTLPGFEH